MSSRRRNAITPRDAALVGAVACTGAVVALFAGCSPTGSAVPDGVLTASFVAFVTWAAASAPWWALVGAAGAVAVLSISSPWLVALAAIAIAIGAGLGLERNSLPFARAASAAITMHVAVRLDWEPFFASRGLMAAGVAALLGVAGLSRRSRVTRRKVTRGLLAVGAFALVALIGLGVGGGVAHSNATRGYERLVEGLSHARNGDPIAASASLRLAATQLRTAERRWTALWSQPARLVPVLAQNRSAIGEVLDRAAAAADAAADALGLIDLDQLRVVGGVVDVEALALLARPLSDLERTATQLADALGSVDTPWLFGPVRDRVDTAHELAVEVARQAHTTSTVATVGPAMLGNDGARRYLVAFTSPGEARGTSGLMGNWAEITVTKGALQLTASGRTSVLIDALRANGEASLTASPDYFSRYGPFGAGDGTAATPVQPKFWSNITMSPDMPSVGSAMAQLYDQATDRRVDGVIVIDPEGLAALLELTGPVTVPDAGITLTSVTVQQYLLFDQYTRAEADREDVLEAVTKATVARVLSAALPGPSVLARELGPAALEGHISMWAERADEEALMVLTGTDASMPQLNGRDGLAVVNNNASGSKIDTFLRRSVRYTAGVNERTGQIQATLTITLENTAPTTGYPEYVIGNVIDLPIGTNRTLLSVYTPLAFTSATLDGQPVGLTTGSESGWQVHSAVITLAPAQTSTLVVSLDGSLRPGDYALVYRPQALASPGQFFAEVTNQNGTTVAGYAGTLRRRSVLSSDGLSSRV